MVYIIRIIGNCITQFLQYHVNFKSIEYKINGEGVEKHEQYVAQNVETNKQFKSMYCIK